MPSEARIIALGSASLLLLRLGDGASKLVLHHEERAYTALIAASPPDRSSARVE